jgi:hypothetical protein
MYTNRNRVVLLWYTFFLESIEYKTKSVCKCPVQPLTLNTNQNTWMYSNTGFVCQFYLCNHLAILLLNLFFLISHSSRHYICKIDKYAVRQGSVSFYMVTIVGWFTGHV